MKAKGLALAAFVGLSVTILGCSSSAEQVAPAPAIQQAPVQSIPTAPPIATQPVAEVQTAPAPAPKAVTVGHEVGNHIPDFAFSLIDGSTVTSDQILSDGRPTFLFFTASW